jgi:hypothetical protein
MGCPSCHEVLPWVPDPPELEILEEDEDGNWIARGSIKPWTVGGKKAPYATTHLEFATESDAKKAFANIKDLLKDVDQDALLKQIADSMMIRPGSLFKGLGSPGQGEPIGVKKHGPIEFKMRFEDRMTDALRSLAARAAREDKRRRRAGMGCDDDPEPDRILDVDHGGVEEVDGPWPGSRAWEWPLDGADKWGEGDWEDEPDKVHWLDGATGLHCLILRAVAVGSLNGYVGVYEGHPLHGKPVDWRRPIVEPVTPSINNIWERATSDPGPCRSSCLGQDIEVHGGLNYAGPSALPETPDDEGRELSIPGDVTGAGETLWWFGFDCGHGSDGCPLTLDMAADMGRDWCGGDGPYRDVVYVGRECGKLARQLAKIGKG